MNSLYDKARNVRLMAFDIDGVMTDGRLYFSPDGDEMKTFFSRDGRTSAAPWPGSLNAKAWTSRRPATWATTS